MKYEHSLTFAAQMQINDYVAKRLASANAELDRVQTAAELLRDPVKQGTPALSCGGASRPGAGWYPGRSARISA